MLQRRPSIQFDPEDNYLRDKCYVMEARTGHRYAYCSGVPVHRILTKAPKGKDVDHINGDTLDNRKVNLRVVSRAINNRNSIAGGGTAMTPYRGVGHHKRSGLWYARIKHHGKVISLGYHQTPELAQLARLTKEKELWGIEPRRLPYFQAAGLA